MVSVNTINISTLKVKVPTPPAPPQSTQISLDEKKKKNEERPQADSSSGSAMLLNQPINYAQNNDVFQVMISMLEQKGKIIGEIIKSFKPSETDKEDEKKFWEKKDLAKVADKAHYASVLAQRAVEDIQSVLKLLNSPTSNPGARAGVVMAELSRIARNISTAMSEAGDASAALTQINPSDPGLKAQKNTMTNSLVQLDKALNEIDSACDKIRDNL